MRGYPPRIATKADVEIAMNIDPVRTVSMLRAAIDAKEGWVVTGRLDSDVDGVTDDTHRVVDRGDTDHGSEWYQEEWGPLPGNILDRIGLSVDDAAAIAGGTS